MRFAGNREIPAIYMVQSDGNETLIPWDARQSGEVAVIHGTSREFRLRRGGDVLCIFNEAYDPVGVIPAPAPHRHPWSALFGLNREGATVEQHRSE